MDTQKRISGDIGKKKRISKNRAIAKAKDRMEQSIIPKRILEDWKSLQCPDCRKGDRSKCRATRENARAFMEDKKGKMHYYCFVGCLMLELPEEARRKFIVSQFDTDGHYEKLANP
jgi:hypothetical protein